MSAELSTWLESLGLADYLSSLRENDIDFETLHHLNDDDLRDLGLSLGHRRRLLAALGNRSSGALQPRPYEIARGTTPERRLLTVLFIDVVDSVSLSRQLDPEEMHDLTRRFQSAVTAAILRYRGYVAQFLGDGVLAYFGWPQAHEDEAERAVRAAREAFTAIRDIETTLPQPLRARAGIATGEVVVGTIDGDLMRDEAAAIGTTPGLADRLQRLARPCEVVIGPLTRRLLGRAFEVEDLGEHRLKGFDEPVRAWRVERESEAALRFEAMREGARAPLVGRAPDLRQMVEVWELARSGRGQVVSVCGEAGIGKSRLVDEFRLQIAGQRRFGYRYQCSPYHTSSPFHPAIQSVRLAAGISDEDSSAAKIEKLETLLSLTPQPLERVVPIVAALLRVPDLGRYAPVDLPPPQLRQETIGCLKEQIFLMSRQHPILVVIEDIHWADASSLDLVRSLVRDIAEAPVMVAVTHRPEFEPDWRDCPYWTGISLKRMGRRQALRIARAVSPIGLADEEGTRIVQRADGVPLFVEELTKAYVDTSRAGFGERVPMTLQNSLVARLDLLGDAKEIAQIGAVIGREFEHRHIALLATRFGLDVEPAIERLIGSGVVLRRGVPPTNRYIFRHALVQDAAYSTLLRRRRREIHRAFADLLESEAPDGREEVAALVARHAQLADDWPRAFWSFRQSAEDAVSRSALVEAADLFRSALAAYENLPDDPGTIPVAVDLMFALRNVLWALGQFEAILEPLEEAERLAGSISDNVRLGWVSVYRGASLWQLGRSHESKAASEHARKVAIAEQDLSLQVASDFYLGCALVTSGELQDAEQHFERVVNALSGALALDKCGLPFAPAVIARSWLVWTCAERSEFDHAEEHAESAQRLAEEIDNPFNRAHIAYDIGYLQIVRGDLAEAIATLERALEIIEEWGLTYLSPFTMGFLGHAEVLAGKVEQGIDRLERASAAHDRIGLGLFKSLVASMLAHGYLRAGRLSDAWTTLDSALALARRRGEKGHEAFGLYVLGEISAETRESGRARARKWFETALARAKDLGMCALATQCRTRLDDLSSLQQDCRS